MRQPASLCLNTRRSDNHGHIFIRITYESQEKWATDSKKDH